jgi:hypothetical protein
MSTLSRSMRTTPGSSASCNVTGNDRREPRAADPELSSESRILESRHQRAPVSLPCSVCRAAFAGGRPQTAAARVRCVWTEGIVPNDSCPVRKLPGTSVKRVPPSQRVGLCSGILRPSAARGRGIVQGTSVTSGRGNYGDPGAEHCSQKTPRRSDSRTSVACALPSSASSVRVKTGSTSRLGSSSRPSGAGGSAGSSCRSVSGS